MPEMAGDNLLFFIFLGDSGLASPYAALREALPAIADNLGWLPCDVSEAERRWRLGPLARWVSFVDSGLSPGSRDLETDVGPLAVALSARWPVAVVRRVDRVLTLLLYKEGVVIDRYANQALDGEYWPGAAAGEGRGGDPSRWVDLLGTPRNAMRLETVWGSWSDADEVLSRTAAIVGWEFLELDAGDEGLTLALRRG